MLFLLSTALVSPAHAGGLKARKALPDPVHDVRLGSSPADVRKKHSSADPLEEESADFRKVYLENTIGHPTVRSVVYYFDADLPGNPLYEVILLFRDPAVRDQVALELYGPPNHEADEWRLPVKGADWELAVWTHHDKLIVAAQMKGTEWEDGVD
ncbi:MAG: hypothetical protein H6737_06595 [Alphaproteobacteria bacterium]|nr:hypothetical protein [Alphaproteobacteria bacterium]